MPWFKLNPVALYLPGLLRRWHAMSECGLHVVEKPAGNSVISRHCEGTSPEAIQLNYHFQRYHYVVYFFWIASPLARNDGLSVSHHCKDFSRNNPVELSLPIVSSHCAVFLCNILKLHVKTLFFIGQHSIFIWISAYHKFFLHIKWVFFIL